MKMPAVAAACLLVAVLLLVSGQPRQAAAMSKFCHCYKQCYTNCRKMTEPYPCNFECLQDCINGMPPPPAQSSSTAPVTAADCGRICVTSICGVMETGHAMAGGAEAACVAHCTKNMNIEGAFAARADKITN
ncbi:hypothetical protein U9M48_025905 [Paspalum notatum var. saurae]|uniref:Uncharacterized protein n=1 Tax=Paspalum notatum var. saurae TaxID=547442 RepID=A0AAQ3WYU4_PASNO